MENYNHTQTGTVLIGILAGVILLLLTLFALDPDSIAIPVVGVVIFLLWLFSRLTIQVTESQLKWSFGPGWFRKSVDLQEIESCQIIRYPWYYGYGIHLTPYGWIYNVSGRDAVHVRLKNGKGILLGTDDPENLKRAINPGMQQNP